MQYHSLLAEAAAEYLGWPEAAILYRPGCITGREMLFLDEATSHLDSESEALVTRAVEAMDMTRVLVAHRKETIAIADLFVARSASGQSARSMRMRPPAPAWLRRRSPDPQPDRQAPRRRRDDVIVGVSRY